MINFMIEYIYSLMYVIGLTFVISLVLPKLKEIRLVKIIISILGYAIIVNVLTYSTASLASFFILGNVMCMITDFIYCCYLINEFKLSNLLVTILFYNLYGIASAMFSIVFMRYHMIEYIAIALGDTRWVITIIINIFAISITYLIFKGKHNIFNEVSKKYIVLYVFINIVELAIALLLNVMLADNDDIFIVLVIVLMVVLMIMSNYSIVTVADKFIEKSKMELLENSYKLNKQYLESVKREQEELSKFRHDYKNHLYVLNGLINEGSIESRNYLINLDNELKSIKEVVYSNNILINTIINAKVSGISDIEFDISIVVKEHLNFPEDKLSSLLFNLLDNAIEAAMKSKEKKVGIKILNNEDMLLIEISNSVDQEPDFISDKGKDHGKGMIIIDEIVSMFEGMIDYEYIDNYMNIQVIINEVNR